MIENNKYKIIVPYTESAAPQKKYKIEYIIEAENRSVAIKKAEKEFNAYSLNSSASWVRIPDQSAIRTWRIFSGDPTNPDFIDELINNISEKNEQETIKILERLGKLEDTTASSKILSLTKSDNAKLVAAAINTLGEIGDTCSFFAIENAFFNKKDKEVRFAVINTLIKLALPEDSSNIIDFYRHVIHDDSTREIVFNLESPYLIPLWLAEINNEHEFEMVKNSILKLGEKALKSFISLNSTHPKVFNYAKKILTIIEPIAKSHKWEGWSEIVKKYKN